MRGVHRISLDIAAEATKSMRSIMQQMMQPQTVRVGSLSSTPASWVATAGHTARSSMLKASVPANVQVISLQSQGPNTVLLRLAHMYAVSERGAAEGRGERGKG